MKQTYDLTKFDKVLASLALIQDKGNFIADCSSKEGYEASKRFVLDETVPARKELTEAHKETKKPFWDTCKFLDAKKNELMPMLEEIEKPHKEAYKAYDQEKKDRKAKFEAAIQDKIDFFHGFKMVNTGTSDQIAAIIDSCGETDTVEGFYHRAADAEKAKQEAMEYLNDFLISTVNCEAEEQRQIALAEENRLRQIEIDKQQEAMRLQQEEMDKKQAELDRFSNEASKKKQAEQRESQRICDEAEQKEREKQAAIERAEYGAKQAREAAEKAKQAEIFRQQEEKRLEAEAAAKREANIRHYAKINNAIVKVLVDNGISGKDAKTVVTLTAKRQVPNLSIKY